MPSLVQKLTEKKLIKPPTFLASIRIFQEAKAVLENSPNFKPDIYNGIQYGYKFVDDKNIVTCNLEERC